MNNTPAQFKAKQMEELSSSIANATITLPITEYEQTLKDAERYRWIRSQTSDTHIMFGNYDLTTGYADLLTAKVGVYLDESIDQAMKDKP
jgi:hypothetical protein